LALMGVYLVVFGLLWKGNTIPHYTLYLLAGLTCWLFFATSVQVASRSLLDSAELIRKVRFPRQLVPFSVVATQLITLTLMLVILIALSLGHAPRPADVFYLAVAAVVSLALVAFVFSRVDDRTAVELWLTPQPGPRSLRSRFRSRREEVRTMTSVRFTSLAASA